MPQKSQSSPVLCFKVKQDPEVEIQVWMAQDWLQNDKAEHRLFAAVLILKALVARLLEGAEPNANIGIISGVLVTVGDLAIVGRFAMRQYISEFMPLIVDALLDGASAAKREVAVVTLGQVVQSTGYLALWVRLIHMCINEINKVHLALTERWQVQLMSQDSTSHHWMNYLWTFGPLLLLLKIIIQRLLLILSCEFLGILLLPVTTKRWLVLLCSYLSRWALAVYHIYQRFCLISFTRSVHVTTLLRIS
ncbi:Serine/threonine-protein kinase TOR [Linum grandiflorum]